MKSLFNKCQEYKFFLIISIFVLTGFSACDFINPPPSSEPTPITTAVPGWDVYEPDNTYLDANEIEVDSIQDHSLHNSTDYDFMMFSAVNGRRYIIQTFSPFDDTDTIMYLFDTDGSTLLAYNDDDDYQYYNMDSSLSRQKAGKPENKTTRSLQSYIEWDCHVDGTYYIAVIGFDGSTGNYAILLLSIPTPDPLMIQDFEAEDVTPGNAEPLNVWGQVDSTYSHDGDGNENGSNGTIAEVTAFSITSDGADGTTRSSTISYTIGDNDTLEYDGPAIAGYGTFPDSPADLSEFSGIQFYARGTGIFVLKVAVRTTEQIAIEENDDYTTTVILFNEWEYYRIPWTNFNAQGWGGDIPPLDPSQIELINLKVEEFDGIQTTGEFSFDQLSTY